MGWGQKNFRKGGGKGVGVSTMDDAMEVWLQIHRRQSCIRDS